jgi:hypothetical protein
MTFDGWGFDAGWHLSQPTGFVGYILLLLYSLVAIGILAATREDWFKLRASQWLLVIALAGAGVLAAETLIVRFPADILPPPGIPVEPQRPGLALLALVPAFLAGGWLGIGPALVVGFLTGLTRAGFETYVGYTAFEYAFLATAAAGAVRQNYTGWLMATLRRPALAGLIFGLGLARRRRRNVQPHLVAALESVVGLDGGAAHGHAAFVAESREGRTREPLGGEALREHLVHALARVVGDRDPGERALAHHTLDLM